MCRGRCGIEYGVSLGRCGRVYEVSVDRLSLRVWEKGWRSELGCGEVWKRHRPSRRRQGCREGNHPPFVKFENAALKIQAL